jgi:hypothetical protein
MFFDRKLRRGPSDFNVTHNLVFNYVWDIPTPKSFSGPLAWTLGGWEFGGILTLSSGVPFTAILGADFLGLQSTDPFDYPNRLGGSACQSLVNPGNPNNYIKLQCFSLPTAPVSMQSQCAPFNAPDSPPPAGQTYCANLLGNEGRNSLIGPGLTEFDMSLFKTMPVKRISETFNVQFRTEVFNILNHANFNPPTSHNTLFNGDGASIAGAGVIDSTSTTSRQIQFALKIIW